MCEFIHSLTQPGAYYLGPCVLNCDCHEALELVIFIMHPCCSVLADRAAREKQSSTEGPNDEPVRDEYLKLRQFEQPGDLVTLPSGIQYRWVILGWTIGVSVLWS